MKKSWKTVSTTILFHHPRVTVVEDSVVLPDGHETAYIRFTNEADYVTVIATRGTEIAFISEYAYPIDEWLWQLPDGSLEPGEAIQQGAARELLEETGLSAQSFTEIGTNLGNHRRSTIRAHVVLAHGAYEDMNRPKAAGDAEEQGTELHWLQTKEVIAMVKDGRIVQKNTLAALAVYFVNFATKPLA